MSPGVYEVIKNFKYLDIPIYKGEILNVNHTGDPRVHGKIWKGFYRDREKAEFSDIFNNSKLKRIFLSEPKNYNLKYLPEDCVRRLD